MIKGYKQLGAAHDLHPQLKKDIFIKMYAFLYLPRYYHRSFETIDKASLNCLAEFGVKPEHIGFEPVPGKADFFKSTSAKHLYTAENNGKA